MGIAKSVLELVMSKEGRLGWYTWRLKRLRIRKKKNGHKWSREKKEAIDAKIDHFKKMISDLDDCR